MRVRLHDKVLPIACRTQIRRGGAPPTTIFCRRLVIAGALLLRAIEIRIGLDAGLDAGLKQELADLPLIGLVGDAQRPSAAVEFARPAFVVLGLAEIRQHGIIVPALATTLPPFVVVGVVAAHIDHAVDRTGATQHLAARLIHHAIVQIGFRLAVEHPVDARIAERLGVAERDVDPGIAVLAAGFQQQHAVAVRISTAALPARSRPSRRLSR